VIRTTIKVPESLKPADRIKLAESAISYIQIRSSEGYDKNGNKFGKYSKKYAEKKGVGRGDVDLVLSGEMLSELKLTKHGKGFIEIGYKNGDEVAGRVEGNILGTYGNDEPVTKPRDFLGIDEGELEIMADALDNETTDVTDADIDQIAKDAAREIFGDIDFE
jgi:hypothetical protein